MNCCLLCAFKNLCVQFAWSRQLQQKIKISGDQEIWLIYCWLLWPWWPRKSEPRLGFWTQQIRFQISHMAAAGFEVISAIHFYYVILSIKWRVFWSGLAAAVSKNIKADSLSTLKANMWFNSSAVTAAVDETNFHFFDMTCMIKT